MPELKVAVDAEDKAALVIDPHDNVAVALTDIHQGETCTVRTSQGEYTVTVTEDIPFGHKLAIVPIGLNESVFKYGEEIGKMSNVVGVGGWIHTHNMYCKRGKHNGR